MANGRELLMANRAAAMGGGGRSAKEYQGNIILNFDAIEHGSGSTWNNLGTLGSEYDLTVSEHGTFANNRFVTDGLGCAAESVADAPEWSAVIATECVFRSFQNYTTRKTVFACAKSYYSNPYNFFTRGLVASTDGTNCIFLCHPKLIKDLNYRSSSIVQVVYSGRESVGRVFYNGQSKTTSGDGIAQTNAKIVVGGLNISTSSGAGNFEIASIRVHGTAPTDEQLAFNRALDVERFNLSI